MRDPELWRKVHDNQLGGDRDKLEALVLADADGDVSAPDSAPNDWTPGVSIHPIELRFPETVACQVSELVFTVYNTHHSDPLTILSITADLSSFQPKNVPGNIPPYEEGAVPPGGRKQIAVSFAPRSAGVSEGTLMVLTDKGSFLINAKGSTLKSPYKVTPLNGVKVPTRFPHVFELNIYNPHATDLFVTEAVSSDQFVQLAAMPFQPDSDDEDESLTSYQTFTTHSTATSTQGHTSTLNHLNVSDLFYPTLESSGALFDGSDASEESFPRHADAAAALNFANTKMKEEDKRYREVLATFDELPKRKQSDSWVIPPGTTKTVLFARLAISRVGHFEGSVRVKLRWKKDTKNDIDLDDVVPVTGAYGENTVRQMTDQTRKRKQTHNTVELRVPITVTSSVGVSVSPNQLDFGVAVRRSDRLRLNLDVFNGASRTATITKVITTPNDPSLRHRLENGSKLLPHSKTEHAISLTYSGKLEGYRVGILTIHTDINEPVEIAYRARVVHGKLEFDNDQPLSFASPDSGKKPFRRQTKTFEVINGFPVALAVTGARVVMVDIVDGSDSQRISDSRVPTTDTLAVDRFSRNNLQVVPPGGLIRDLTVTYQPKDTAQLFDARLLLTTNLTTLTIPLRVYHGQLACYDAAQAATRAAAASAAAANAYSTVTPAGSKDSEQSITEDAQLSDSFSGSLLGKEGSGLAVPCAVSDGKYREAVGLSIMGVIDFGVVQVGNERFRRIAVRNPNPVPVAITSVTSTVRAVRVTRVEVSAASVSAPISPSSVSTLQSRALSRNAKKAPFRPKPPTVGCLTDVGKMAACEQSFLLPDTGDRAGGVNETTESAKGNAAFSLQPLNANSHVVLPPDHVATIDVLAAPAEEELVRMGGMLSFGLDNGRVLVAPVVMRALKGDVEVVVDEEEKEPKRGIKPLSRKKLLDITNAIASDTPVEGTQGGVSATVDIPAAFPGRTTVGELKLRSSFAEAVTVAGFSSEDPAVFLNVKNEKLKPGKVVSVGQIVFDPSRLTDELAYTGLTFMASKDGSTDVIKYASRATEEEKNLIRADAFETKKYGLFSILLKSIFGINTGAQKHANDKDVVRRSVRSHTAVSNARALSLTDIFELKRARNAWAKVAGGEDPHAASSALVESKLTLHTDAVDAIEVTVTTKLIRPKMLLFSGDDDDEFETAFGGDGEFLDHQEDEEDEEEAIQSSKDLATNNNNNKPKNRNAMAKSARVVDFGSVQVGAKTRRRRVVFINPFASDTLCVKMLPIVPASAKNTKGKDRRVSGGKGALDDVLEAADAHYRGEYPLHTGFLLEGGELSSGRGGVSSSTVGTRNADSSRPSGGWDQQKMSGAASPPRLKKDWTCLKPYQKIDLGALVFAPKESRQYAAHLCVRNNFTTLECATLRGDGDAVKVQVAKTKKPRSGAPPVTDVAFRMARERSIGSSDSDYVETSPTRDADVMTQVVYVVNDGTALARVSKPWVGAVECGGDGTVGGYTVSPCGPFQLAPGASKRLTVVCHPEHALTSSKAPGAWTQLAMDVKSADGESSRLVVQLFASSKVVSGVYAAGELENVSAWGWSATKVFGTVLGLCAAWFLSKEIAVGGKGVVEGSVSAGAVTSAVASGASSVPMSKRTVSPSTSNGKTLAQRRREARGDGGDETRGAPVLTKLETPAEDTTATRDRSQHLLRGEDISPDSVMRDGVDGDIDSILTKSPDSNDPSQPDTPPSPVVDSSAESAAAAIAAMTRRTSEKRESEGEGLPDTSADTSAHNRSEGSPLPSPKAGRRHLNPDEKKPMNSLTLSSIPKPKVKSGSPQGSQPASPVGTVSPKTLASSRAKEKLKPEPVVSKPAGTQNSVLPIKTETRTPVSMIDRPVAPHTNPPLPTIPPPGLFGGGLPRRAPNVADQQNRNVPQNSNSPLWRIGMQARTDVQQQRPADQQRPAQPPLPPSSPPANAARAFTNPFSPTARQAEATATAAGLSVFDSPNVVGRFNANAGNNLANTQAGGWVPSPPRSDPSQTQARQPQPTSAFRGALPFGGGIGLNLLSGGGSGYNMWGAPAPPPARDSNGGFGSSFFDASDSMGEALEPGRTQSADLDAETEWSNANKELLDDLGLD